MRIPAVLSLQLILTGILLTQQMSVCGGLKIAAFNIQQLGVSKINNDDFTTPLTKFICAQAWDIAFLQELTSEEVIIELTNKLNANEECAGVGIQYSEVHSDKLPLEATSGREIYAYIYRESKISNFTAEIHQEQMQYHVGGENLQADIFFRPPFVARVEVDTVSVPELQCMPEFLLIGMHTRPVRTYSEVNGLVNVYDATARVRGINGNALILGDLNADCSSFGPVDESNSVLRESYIFNWLIEDGVKTNSASSRDCTYDRIIAAGATMNQSAANVDIPRWEEEDDLSDHWPVSVDLQCPEELVINCNMD